METIDLKDAVISVVSSTLAIGLLLLKNKLIKFYEKTYNKEKDPVVAALNISKLIRDTLKKLMECWHANRAIIVQFHNGGHFYTGASMQKLSVTYEEHTPGMLPLYRILQNVPLTTCMYIKDVVDENYVISDTDEVKDIISKTFYHEFGVKSVIGVPIYKGERVIGAVILQYIDKKMKFKDSDLALLSDQCMNFHTLLSTQ